LGNFLSFSNHATRIDMVVQIGKRVLSYSITPLHVCQHCWNKSERSKIVPTMRMWTFLYTRSITSFSVIHSHTQSSLLCIISDQK